MRRVSLLLALAIMALLAASTAFAQMNVRLRVITAANDARAVDPPLRDLYRELGSLFSFTSYRLIREEHLSLYPSLPASIQAHPGRFIEVTLVRQRRESCEVRVRVIREGKDILNTMVRLSPGRTVLIGGPRHGDRVIIFALSYARY